ncbi:MAG: hypothetical protein AAGI23_22955 [Bacteroidota bacterium]
MRYLTLVCFVFCIQNLLFAQVNSRLEVFNLATEERSMVYEEAVHFEAPNWSSDGQFFVINSLGKLYKLSLDGQHKSLIDTNFANNCNNDHGISPDGKQLVISHYDDPNATYENRDFRTSRIFTLPIEGGKPKVVTAKTPSFWHGWSPDGKTLLYTALRDGEFDIYSIPVTGGEETRLTFEKGLDDGSDYSHDGKYIYYNSMQSGSMEIWRMEADGRDKQQLTDDTYSNWFPHPSPDGKYIVFLSYLEDQGDRHPAMKRVALRLYDLKTKNIKTLCRFIGGQGSINVPSWSPDGQSFAFVSYEAKQPSLPDLEQLYVFVDADLPATAYIDGKLDKERVGQDEMYIFQPKDKQLVSASKLKISNSVRRWLNSADVKKIKDKKYILVAEQDGQRRSADSTLSNIPQARLLSLLDVSDLSKPAVVDTMHFVNIPTCVAFHPDQNLFALTFMGSHQIALGHIENGKMKIIAHTDLELSSKERIPAIPHFTWHPDGRFAAVTLAANDKIVFLKLENDQFTIWGNELKTAPLPGVGYFVPNGQFFISTTISLTGDIAQNAYGDNSSLLTIYRFDDDEMPNSPPTRSDDGRSDYFSPKVKHNKTAQLPFGQGYVETFTISPDGQYLIGLNMRASWLPERYSGRTQTSELCLFRLDDKNGKASLMNTFPFEGILPESITFDRSGKSLLVAVFDQNGVDAGSGRIDVWQLIKEDSVTLTFYDGYLLPRGVHYLLWD